ncbi:hypothetical protein AHAS_Ahas05G0011000 [Arachis hypogaea]
MQGKVELFRLPQSSAMTPPKTPPSSTRDTVNSGEDLVATHFTAVKHAGEAELLRMPYHQRRLHHNTPPCEDLILSNLIFVLPPFFSYNLELILPKFQENPRRVTSSP